jgi:hypothetical protein
MLGSRHLRERRGIEGRGVDAGRRKKRDNSPLSVNHGKLGLLMRLQTPAVRPGTEFIDGLRADGEWGWQL